MSDKLTAIRIKYPNGTYSEQILFGVLVENVQVNSTTNLSTTLDMLEARIDQIVAPTSSTLTLDEEVRDIRVGKDATRTTVVNYTSAGEAVRTQLDEMKESIDSELTDLKDIVDDKLIKYIDYSITEDEYVDKTNGSIVSYDAWDRTNFIEVDNTKTLYIYNGGARTTYCGQYENENASSFLRNFIIENGWNKVILDPLCTRIVISAARRNNTVNLLKIRNDLFAKNKAVADRVFQVPNFIDVKWTSGSLDDNGNVVYSVKRLVSEYIELPRKNMELHISIDNWQTLIYEYDSTKTHVYHPSSYKTSDYRIITSPETKYIRVLCCDRRDINKELYPDDIYTSDILVTAAPMVEKLKVMTYNVGHYAYGTGMGLPSNIYDEKLRNYRRFLGDENVDVIGIQEFDSWMNDADTEANAIKANDVLWDHSYPYKIDTGSAASIKSKEFAYWTYKNQLTTGSWYVRAYINGICLISVHLSVGTANTQTRITEANEIVSILQNEDRFIMFGDFNCEPGEENTLYNIFTSAGYNLANCGWFDKYYTWSNVRADFDDYENPSGTALYYIDNIITSNNIKIVNAYPVPDAYSKLSSDHIPFVAELEIIV